MSKIQLTLLLVCLAFYVKAQPFFTETFDVQAKFETESFTKGPFPAKWVWTSNGMASPASYWKNRPAISSKSKGGAIVFDANLYADQVTKKNSKGDPVVFDESITVATVDCAKRKKVFVKFNQYFRDYEASCDLLVSINNGAWQNFPVNDKIVTNVETGRNDYRVVDISGIAQGQNNVKLGFRYQGKNYFWIIDDVEVWDEEPYEETFPKELGQTLRALGIDYRVDEKGGAYRPDEIVVKFSSTSTPAERSAIQESTGAALIDSCEDGEVQLWKIGDEYFTEIDGKLSPVGPNVGNNERTANAKPKGKIEGSGPNYFVFNDLDNVQPNTSLKITEAMDGGQGQATAKNAVKIAILDTGYSFGHDALIDHFAINSQEKFDNTDSDNNDYEDDYAGWNFVGDNNNTYDDHSHGTHVAGIVMKNLKQAGCTYSILPVKTHDASGISDVFKSSCATYYAINQKANIINASWGYYGLKSEVLSLAFKAADTKNILVVASAGNEGEDLGKRDHFPSGFRYTNIISVGAANGTRIADYSNYSKDNLDILAPGNVESCLPDGSWGQKEGTSMAAPAVVAAAAIVFCNGITKPQEITSRILSCAQSSFKITNYTKSGKLLSINHECLANGRETMEMQQMEPQKLEKRN